MNWSFDELSRDLTRQTGNGGRLLSPTGSGDCAVVSTMMPIDKTTAAAKLIINDEAEKRARKTARLKLDRQFRDQGKLV
jgi:hypothetical protein